MKHLSNQREAHLLLFLVALIYGANYSVAKLIMDPGLIGPNGFILCRIATAFLLFRIFYGKLFRIERKDWPSLAFVTVTGVLINQLFFFNGLSRTSPIHAALIMLTTPILVLIFGSFKLHSSFRMIHWIGCLMGFLGTFILILTSNSSSEYVHSSVLGDLMIFANAISYAIYLNHLPKLITKYPAFEILKWIFGLAFLLCLPFGIVDIIETSWTQFNSIHWASFGFVLFATTFLTYLFNAKAMQISNPGLVSNYIYLQPLLAIGIASAFNKDVLTLSQVLCGMVIFCGLFLSAKK